MIEHRSKRTITAHWLGGIYGRFALPATILGGPMPTRAARAALEARRGIVGALDVVRDLHALDELERALAWLGGHVTRPPLQRR